MPAWKEGGGNRWFTTLPSGVICSNAHFCPNLHPPLAKYLHGAGRVVDSRSWEKGHIRPAWHCPCRKNLHGTCCVSALNLSHLLRSVSLPFPYVYSLLFFGGLLGMGNGPANPCPPPTSPGMPPGYGRGGAAIGIAPLRSDCCILPSTECLWGCWFCPLPGPPA